MEALTLECHMVGQQTLWLENFKFETLPNVLSIVLIDDINPVTFTHKQASWSDYLDLKFHEQCLCCTWR